MNHSVSEIQIIPVKPQNGLLAFASCVLNESLYIGSIAIHKKLKNEGYRLTYPTKIIGNKEINLFHPINRELSQKLEKEIIGKYKSLMA